MANGYVGIPTSYTPVEYIESSGTQFIDTEIYPSNSTKVILDYQLTATSFTISNTNILRAYNSANAPSFDCFCAGGSGVTTNARFCFGATSSYYAQFLGLNSNVRHIVEVDCPNSRVVVDNSSIYSVTSSTFACAKTLRLPQATCLLKIYSCKIYDNGILVRDFIPAIDDKNVACLYEQVEGKFYYNQGTGSFAAGTATGQPVSLGDKARKIVSGYVGINDIARKIINGYVGVNGVARLMWRGRMYRTLRTFTRNSPSKYEPYVTSTNDYVLVGAGYESSNSTTNAKVNAYDINCIETSCTDLPATARRGMTMRCGGYGIMASGNYTSSQSSVRTNCTAYDNNLTRTQMSAVTTGVYRAQTAGNDTHCILEGGSNYNAFQTSCQSYNSSLVKSSLSSDQQRLARGASNIGNYILLVGARGLSSVSIYDNSNVKTTTSNPYNNASDGVLGVSTDEYAMFFGGNTNNSTNISNSYSDIVAYDKNVVKITSSLPSANSGLQGFTFDTSYALVLTGTEGLIYDNNLQIQERFSAPTTREFFSLAEANSTFGLMLVNGSLATTQIIF